jgi:CHAT domain-containing protein
VSIERERIGPLPHARREASDLRQRFRQAHLLVGTEATEHALKSSIAEPVKLLHIGAHAVVDWEHPERSAILLAPGDASEDGLLQTREIVDLSPGPHVVVLSACQSATGEVLEGEGPMSLARPFFVAGARAVLGSLWPLRDDEAATLFSDFYRHLAAGSTLAGALASARADRAAAGDPAAAWAGVVLLGDGDLVPFPGGVEARVPLRAIAVGAVIAALAAAAVTRLRTRRRRLHIEAQA